MYIFYNFWKGKHGSLPPTKYLIVEILLFCHCHLGQYSVEPNENYFTLAIYCAQAHLRSFLRKIYPDSTSCYPKWSPTALAWERGGMNDSKAGTKMSKRRRVTQKDTLLTKKTSKMSKGHSARKHRFLPS